MNIFNIPKEKMPQELVDTLFLNEKIKIKRIVSKGHTTDWEIQNEDEWVCLVTGEAEIEFENKKITLIAGDTLFIAKNQKHRVTKTTDCVWICVFV